MRSESVPAAPIMQSVSVLPISHSILPPEAGGALDIEGYSGAPAHIPSALPPSVTCGHCGDRFVPDDEFCSCRKCEHNNCTECGSAYAFDWDSCPICRGTGVCQCPQEEYVDGKCDDCTFAAECPAMEERMQLAARDDYQDTRMRERRIV